ncbi:MAG: zinc metalloprotease HtpX [Sulfurimicrobium sp.]|jgi:heat shock protein HtpX|nr:zinc metalloprotease HtpX [Sulfurimicrobium sp.]MDP1703735.1 zinc metalloprotease HtpX [Sulfurimicrobium sp.]MDP1898743.1 zinc metalloprotease HtpX [Sulfurimicrobium sp.]MDP2200339.1 zinc metalloprotease HtpX [Sulfurimicrobium sp.]MDP2963662.1 zinc metalloprotease HtpX [Sulfurimicrobium sp.]
MLGNWFKTTILMAAIVALFGMIGATLGGRTGMLLALVFAGGMNVWAYWFSDQAVLRMYNAREVDESSAPQFYRMVRELSHNAGLPMPRVYVIDEDQPNAFATGRNPEHAAVAATTGIMRVLSERELRGVMAHELAHVRHRDTLISTISATIAGAISSIAQFGMLFGGSQNGERNVHPVVAILIMIVAPIAAALIQMAISRSREFEADRGGAEISRDPEALAAALDKIHRYAQGLPMATAEQHPETAQMMIINPLSADGIKSLFSTHPATEERVARLMAMARGLA